MIVFDCLFDPVRDQNPVDQFGFIDLKTALDSSNIPSQLPDADSDYNGIQNPEAILGKPRDIFEAIDSQKALEEASKVSKSDASEGDA